jgi:multimeric flavodoxin WrbA
LIFCFLIFYIFNFSYPMKITVFNGSHRGRGGNTDLMVTELLAGAAEAGAEVENIFLIGKKIGLCRGCFHCWTKTPGACVIPDDMAELLPKFLASDIVVFATPLYVDNVSGLTKLFMDRLIPAVDPRMERDEDGESRHCKRQAKYPKIAVLSNCGFPEQSHFHVLSLLFRRIARNIHSEVVAEIYRGEGEMLRSAPLAVRPLIWRYNQLLRRAGRELAEVSRLSPETAEKLGRPIVPARLYSLAANRHWQAESPPPEVEN